MKKINKYIFFIIGSLIAFSSCNDFEDIPIEQFTIDYVFSRTDSLGTNAQQYLGTIYMGLDQGHNRIEGDYLDAATDDAVTSYDGENDIKKLASGQYTAASLVNSDMRWWHYFEMVRKANTFIENIDIVPLMETYNNGIRLNRAWKAEARFLRAYYYFEMVKRYGGVPIIKKPFELHDDMQIPRNTFEECIDFILNEVEAIKDSLRTIPLPNTETQAHVVTQQAAMAFKSRVLLYAASPLFNEKPIASGNELIGYKEYKTERWKLAADAAKYFIDNYTEFALDPEFKNIFLNWYGYSHQEIIFFRQYGKNYEIEKNNGPVGYTGDNLANGRTSPTQNLVDAFPMLDGKAIGESSKYSYSYNTMYENRDPRLDKTVLHNGSMWLNNPLETYEGGKSNSSNITQKTRTTYYLRKFMGDFEEKSKYEDVEARCWVMFRYAEILLNYAEAQNEYAGPSNEVYQVLKDLRNRAGIEAGDDNMYGLKQNMNKDEMRKAIQNERRIELAFEEHRFWDIRRWKTAEDIFKNPLRGLIIIKGAGFYNFNEVNIQTINFESKRYLYPIPYSEVNKNDNMVQNPGW